MSDSNEIVCLQSESDSVVNEKKNNQNPALVVPADNSVKSTRRDDDYVQNVLFVQRNNEECQRRNRLLYSHHVKEVQIAGIDPEMGPCHVWAPAPASVQQTKNMVACEYNSDGYGQIRINGVCKQANQEGWVKKRKKIYIHHFSYLLSGKTFEKTDNQRWTCSHLCHNRGCFNSKHIVFEPHSVNLQRRACSAQFCNHIPKCCNTRSVHSLSFTGTQEVAQNQ